MSLDYPITMLDLRTGQEKYAEHEPRGLFYRAATALVELARSGNPPLTTAEALAVLLQTWNRAYYRYRPFNGQHLTDIEGILTGHQSALAAFRERSIEGLTEEDGVAIKKVFDSFEHVLGPVGAAKSLHLLAQNFFPLWDGTIAKKYRLPLRARGSNADNYCQFMKIAREQVKMLGGNERVGRNALKAIDEHNYWLYTLSRKQANSTRS